MSASLEIRKFRDSDELEVRDVFFQTSTKKNFLDQDEKEKFFYKYLGLYLEHYPEFAYVSSIDQVIGYCVGSPQTNYLDLIRLQPHLSLFEDLFAQFPAHLHINFLPDFQGKGLGSKLLLAFEAELAGRNIAGVHIMTSSKSRNVAFYRRLGFTFECERESKDGAILFMGKLLT